MQRSRSARLAAAALLLGAVSARGQSELELFEADAKLKEETTVASIRPATVRDSPGILTLISRDEILAAGARDLLDILQLVPGFAPGVDVEGVVDVGFRGVWGHEGKILLILDGQEMNETLFSSLQLGHELPAEQIQSVEIIRGPGSARYGGNAELAVINVKTRSAQDLKGVSASATYGQTTRDFGHRGLSLAGGKVFEDGSASLSGYFGQGNRSDRAYDDLYGNHGPMTDGNSTIDPSYLNFAGDYKGLHARAIYHRLDLHSIDGYGQVQPAEKMQFISLLGELSYDWKLSDTLRITPEFHYKRQLPWRNTDKASDTYYDKTAERYTGRVTASWVPADSISAAAGVDGYVDRAWLNDSTLVGSQNTFNGEGRVAYQNLGAFGEASWRTILGTLLAGARFEHHSLVGNSFVPRLALTKVLDPFHLKLLYSEAFRAPGIEDIALAAGPLVPERTRIFEAETGMRIAEGVFASVNVFDLTVENPIIYTVDPVSSEQVYLNAGQTGSRGVESEIHLTGRRGSIAVGYSFYTAAGKNDVDLYKTADAARLLGMPSHKVALRGTWQIDPRFSLNGNLTWYSQRASAVSLDTDGNPVIGALGAATLVDLLFRMRDVGAKGLELAAGVHNLLDTDFRYAQPYNASHAPLPGQGREYMVRLSYDYGIP